MGFNSNISKFFVVHDCQDPPASSPGATPVPGPNSRWSCATRNLAASDTTYIVYILVSSIWMDLSIGSSKRKWNHSLMVHIIMYLILATLFEPQPNVFRLDLKTVHVNLASFIYNQETCIWASKSWGGFIFCWPTMARPVSRDVRVRNRSVPMSLEFEPKSFSWKTKTIKWGPDSSCYIISLLPATKYHLKEPRYFAHSMRQPPVWAKAMLPKN